jgi:hypothetical protein
MEFAELHVTEDAEIWDYPEQFLEFIKSLAKEAPVLLVIDDAGYIVKRKGDTNDERPEMPGVRGEGDANPAGPEGA